MHILTRFVQWFKHWFIPSHYDAEVGGYVHDTTMSIFIPPTVAHPVTGTYTWAAGSVTGTIILNRAAHDSVGVITIPICPPQSSVANKGAYLKSIDVWYEVTAAPLDALAALVHSFTLPANGAAFPTVTSRAFSYDTVHATATNRDDADEHKMTLTLDTPFWMDADTQVLVQISADSDGTSVFKLHGARANFTLRI